MPKNTAFATKIPTDLKKSLDEVCENLGLRKNFVVESALREKLEELLDTHDLDEAIRESSGFHPWESIKKEAKIKN